ncbi:MAG: UDP-3-O-(3-hydroxymyristoyl)glucosamine N-acyltransferase [Pseudomonadales bacterium]
MNTGKKAWTLGEIAVHLGAQLQLREQDVCAIEQPVSGVATLSAAVSDQIAFLANPRYRAALADTDALAVIVAPALADAVPVHALLHDDPYAAYAALTQLFESRARVPVGIDAAALVSDRASIGEGARVAAGVVIGAGAVIGEDAEICANAVIENDVRLGTACFIGANVTLCHGVRLGSGVRIQAGAVIGAEGFGYAPLRDERKPDVQWRRIAQLGSVMIGDRVEIGANTTIDRGALDDTVIEKDVIIDNQVQVAHNVRIGSGTAIAGCVGIAGSATIGRNCSIGGGVGIAGHLSIADGSSVLGMSLVNRSIDKPGVYASGSGLQEASSWRKSAVRYTQLEALNKRVKSLEAQLQHLHQTGKPDA